MITAILALIGIAFLLRYLSRLFTSVGNLLIELGDRTAMHVVYRMPVIHEKPKDEDYLKKIRQEINELTK